MSNGIRTSGLSSQDFATPRLIDFAEDVSDEKTELEHTGFLFNNDLQQKTTE